MAAAEPIVDALLHSQLSGKGCGGRLMRGVTRGKWEWLSFSVPRVSALQHSERLHFLAARDPARITEGMPQNHR